MPRAASRGEIKARALELADVVNDPSINPAWVNQLFNTTVTSVWEFMIECGPSDYVAATHSITTSPNVLTYGLPQNFHSLTGVFVVENGKRRPLSPISDRARCNNTAPTNVVSVEVEYNPSCPIFSVDGETIDGVNGFDDLIVHKMAKAIAMRRAADPTWIKDEIKEIEDRIRRHAGKRDRGGPKYINDVEGGFSPCFSSLLVGYRLRGNNLELYEARR